VLGTASHSPMPIPCCSVPFYSILFWPNRVLQCKNWPNWVFQWENWPNLFAWQFSSNTHHLEFSFIAGGFGVLLLEPPWPNALVTSTTLSEYMGLVGSCGQQLFLLRVSLDVTTSCSCLLQLFVTN
jgi:hypothetical protein